MANEPRIAVIGGGVNGIGTALAILQKVPGVKLTVYSEKYSPATTGDGAAGLWTPYLSAVTSPEKIIKWSKGTWDLLHAWWKAGNPGVLMTSVYRIDCKEMPEPIYKQIPFGFRSLSQKELKEFGTNYMSGYMYSAFVAEPSKFLPKLIEDIHTLGGKFITKRINTLCELCDEADIIINCTGIGSYDLVPDHEVFPIRGQVIRVNAPWIKTCIMDDSEDNFCYIIPNSNSVVLGGTHQENDWRTTVDFQDSQTIKKNCLKVMPTLKGAEIVTEWVGLRPARKGGVRLEVDEIRVQSRKIPVVHNYGHGGSGVTLFWGCALNASDLVVSILNKCNAPIISRL